MTRNYVIYFQGDLQKVTTDIEEIKNLLVALENLNNVHLEKTMIGVNTTTYFYELI